MTRYLSPLLRLMAFVVLIFGAQAAMAIEEPKFKRELSDGNFELRAYSFMIAAEVIVDGSRDGASNEGFRLLADYIFGNNQKRVKMAMTAPVTQSAQKQSEKIAMTAPVNQTKRANGWAVRFIMPSEQTMDTLPIPNNKAVSLVEIPAHRTAVIRFSGFTGEKDIELQTQKLKDWMATKSLKAGSEVTVARYDPPWTPWFARRNEIHIAVVD